MEQKMDKRGKKLSKNLPLPVGEEVSGLGAVCLNSEFQAGHDGNQAWDPLTDMFGFLLIRGIPMDTAVCAQREENLYPNALKCFPAFMRMKVQAGHAPLGLPMDNAACVQRDENRYPNALKCFPAFMRMKVQAGYAPLGLPKMVSQDSLTDTRGKMVLSNKQCAENEGVGSNRGKKQRDLVATNDRLMNRTKIGPEGTPMADEDEIVRQETKRRQVSRGVIIFLEARRQYDIILGMYNSKPEKLGAEVFTPIPNNPKVEVLLPRLSAYIVGRFRVVLERRDLSLICHVVHLQQTIAKGHAVIENHLHGTVLMAASCVIYCPVNDPPDEIDDMDKHIGAAGIVAETLLELSKEMTELVAKIYKTALYNPDSGLMAIFGAIVGLTKMGPEVIQRHLLPAMQSISSRLSKIRSLNAVECKADKILLGKMRTIFDEHHLLY